MIHVGNNIPASGHGLRLERAVAFISCCARSRWLFARRAAFCNLEVNGA